MRVLLWSIIVLVLLFGVWYAFVIAPHKWSQKQSQSQSLSSLVMQIGKDVDAGNYKDAVRDYDRVLTLLPNESQRQYIIFHRETARFRVGDEASRHQAISTIADLVANVDVDAHLRSWAVSSLLTFYSLDSNPQTLDFILAQEPFLSIAKITKDNRRLAVRQIAEYGNSLSPISQLYLTEGMWYAVAMLDRQQDQEEQKQYGERVAGIIEKAKLLRASEKAPFSEAVEMSYLSSLGFLQGALYVGKDKSYPDDFEGTFRQALALADANEGSMPILESVLYTRYYYAVLLQRLYGDDRVDDTRRLLNDLVVAYHSVARPEDLGFTHFLRVYSVPSNDEDNTMRPILMNLSQISSEFKALLNQNGWSL